MSNVEICAGCNHVIGLHFQDVRGVARCLAVVSRELEAVGGSALHCDCADYKSEMFERKKAAMVGLDEETQRTIERIIKGVSSHLTIDPNDPRLGRGIDEAPIPQHEVYLVLSEEEREKGFVRPYRDQYKHLTCGSVTTMGRALSETYARQPTFYGATYCCNCQMHKPVSEFIWDADGETVGS